MKHTIFKDVKLAMALGLIITVLLSVVRFDANCATLRGSMLRLHVLANSDSEEDQSLKLKVRDALLEYADNLFADCNSEEEVLQLAANRQDELQKIAQQKVYEYGYDYSVNLSIGKAYFNTREYTDFTLPAGEYDAVRVIIGQGAGQNWWCVLFPPVCLPAAQADIRQSLNEENAKFVEGGDTPKYKIAFKSVEIFEDIKQFLKKYAHN